MELLVVLAIITVLVSAGLVLYSTTRTRSRDTTREQHVKTLQNALQIYVTNNRLYPVYSGFITGQDDLSLLLKEDAVIQEIPFDPLNTGDYRYHYDSPDGADYTITYYLETNSIAGKSAGLNQAGP